MDFESSRAEASCSVASEPVFLFCAWYEPLADVSLAFAVTGLPGSYLPGVCSIKVIRANFRLRLAGGREKHRGPEAHCNGWYLQQPNQFHGRPPLYLFARSLGKCRSRGRNLDLTALN